MYVQQPKSQETLWSVGSKHSVARNAPGLTGRECDQPAPCVGTAPGGAAGSGTAARRPGEGSGYRAGVPGGVPRARPAGSHPAATLRPGEGTAPLRKAPAGGRCSPSRGRGAVGAHAGVWASRLPARAKRRPPAGRAATRPGAGHQPPPARGRHSAALFPRPAGGRGPGAVHPRGRALPVALPQAWPRRRLGSTARPPPPAERRHRHRQRRLARDTPAWVRRPLRRGEPGRRHLLPGIPRPRAGVGVRAAGLGWGRRAVLLPPRGVAGPAGPDGRGPLGGGGSVSPGLSVAFQSPKSDEGEEFFVFYFFFFNYYFLVLSLFCVRAARGFFFFFQFHPLSGQDVWF